jgi:AcrR family transcriptional regulator
MSSKPIRVPSADRREQIIGVALNQFARNGYRGTTTREIAERAGVNEAILFRHFASKEELYLAVVDSKCGPGKLREFRETLNGATPREALVALAEEILRRNEADPNMTRLYLFTALENHKLSHRMFRTYALRYYEIVADYIRKCIRRGEFRRVDPRLAARSFIGMIAQHYQTQELFGEKRYRRLGLRRVSEALTDIWLGGLSTHNGSRRRNGIRQKNGRARKPGGSRGS